MIPVMVSPIFPMWYVLRLPVVVEVAALAQVAQVVVWGVGVCWVVLVVAAVSVHVCRSEHHHAAGVRVWVGVGGAAVGIPG
jgi:hypothetical protein